MHIVYVIAQGGGPDANARTLGKWLAARGHRVSFVYMNAREAGASREKSVYHARTGPYHYYLKRCVGGFRAWPLRLRALEAAHAAHRALRQIEASTPIDLVEVTEGLPVGRLAREWPVVLRAHGSDWTFRHFCGDGDSRWDARLVEEERRALERADAVSAISHHLAEHLAERCRIPSKRIHVIPYPVDLERFCPDDSFHERLTLTSVGRLERRKGTDVLLRIMHQVWRRFPDARVLLLGKEGDLTRSELLDLVPKVKRNQVSFTGFVQHDDVARYYRATSIYVAPTRYETFAYTILEAMSSAVPVVATRVGAVPELVESGVNGLLVTPGDPDVLSQAITDLLARPDRRRTMGAAGRERARRYGLEEVGTKLQEFYSEVISRRTKTSS